MKQSLDLKLGQHLTITPQLQQEIQEALESNPLLEENEREDETPDAKNETELSASDSADATSEDGGEASSDEADALTATDTDNAPGEENDAEWDETFEPMTAPTASRSTSGDDFPDVDARNSPPQTLRDHLLWQMQMTPFSDTDKQIALALIDAVNEDGYLSCKLEEIQQALGKNHAIEIDEIEAVLHQIQNYDPLGVGARDLAECLRLQMKALPSDTPGLKAATELATP